MPSDSPARHGVDAVVRRFPSRVRAVVGAAGAAVLLLAGGCRDAQTGLTELVIAPETRAALSLPGPLPVLPSLLQRGAQAGAFIPARVEELTARWEATWVGEGAGPAGWGAREVLYRTVSTELGRALGPEGVRRSLRGLERGLATAREADADLLPPSHAERVEAATEEAARAHAYLEAGRTGNAVEAVLEGADHLRSLTPDAVAAELVRRAEGAWSRIGPDAPYGEEERARIGRLVRGARTALEEGDLPRAIHRGFYACRLLGVELR